MKYIFIISLLVSYSIDSSAEEELVETQCEFDESRLDQIVYESFSGIPDNFKPSKSKYVQNIKTQDVVIDVRKTFFDQTPSRVTITDALKIPLYQVKTKNYLKDQSIVLVGDGLDDYFLEQELTKLEKLGFNKINILEYGIPSLIGSGRLNTDQLSSFSLRVSSAKNLVAGSSGNDETNRYLFINTGEPNSAYKILGLNFVEIPFADNGAFYDGLYTQALTAFKDNQLARVVLVHDDPNVYSQMARSSDKLDMLGLWFMGDGNRGLAELMDKILSTSDVGKKVVVSCGG